MPSTHRPRQGSMQFWPRVRAKKESVRVRSWPESKDAKPLGFAGYKVGMTHVMVTDTRKNSDTKGLKLRMPVTVIECPDIKIIGARFYKKSLFGLTVASEVEFKSDNKRLSKRKTISKSPKEDLGQFKDKLSSYSEIRVIVHTLPSETSIGKKTPEVFEVALGGNVEEQFNYINENKGKNISVSDIFTAGELMDTRAVTIGKGTQGPVKRFGISIRGRKSEKTKRGPGSLGGWKGHGHFMYRVAHAGQMGYHTRTEYNKQILKISDNPEEINPKGGFVKYGFVKGNFILVKGSITGHKKRLIRFNKPLRPSKKHASFIPAIEYISLDSKQGN